MKCFFHNTSIMQNVKYSSQRKSSGSRRGKEGLKVKEQVPPRSDRMSESRAPPCPWLFIYFYSWQLCITAVIYLYILFVYGEINDPEVVYWKLTSSFSSWIFYYLYVSLAERKEARKDHLSSDSRLLVVTVPAHKDLQIQGLHLFLGVQDTNLTRLCYSARNLGKGSRICGGRVSRQLCPTSAALTKQKEEIYCCRAKKTSPGFQSCILITE